MSKANSKANSKAGRTAKATAVPADVSADIPGCAYAPDPPDPMLRRYPATPADARREAVLFAANASLVPYTLNRYYREVTREEEEDLIAAGYVGLLTAIRGHDPNKGALATIAVKHIRRNMGLELYRCRRQFTRVPGAAVKRSTEAAPRVASFDVPIAGRSDEPGATLAALLADPEADTEREAVERLEGDETRLWQVVAAGVDSGLVTGEQARLLRLRAGGVSQAEAARLLNLNGQSAAMRAERAALLNLRDLARKRFAPSVGDALPA